MSDLEEGMTGPELAELRRPYHDRIAALRGRSLRILSFSVTGVPAATAALLSGNTAQVLSSRPAVLTLRSEVEVIDAEVVSVLALESPVARDLRVVLAARDVGQIGYLCAGLCVALAGRAGRAQDVLMPSLTGLVAEVSRATTTALDHAARAWSVLDADTALGLIEPVADARVLATRLVGALLDVEDVPMDAALDLAMASRAFDRLIDHAEEVAAKVCFAAGVDWPAAPA